jgi:hypothetical protein
VVVTGFVGVDVAERVEEGLIDAELVLLGVGDFEGIFVLGSEVEGLGGGDFFACLGFQKGLHFFEDGVDLVIFFSHVALNNLIRNSNHLPSISIVFRFK